MSRLKRPGHAALLLSLSAWALCACSVTLPVRGQFETASEAFTGTATGRMDGAGELKVVGDRGSVCSGNFVYVTSREGQGTLTCQDGRSGPFEFVSTGMRGTGHGQLAGQRFTFTFGKEK